MYNVLLSLAQDHLAALMEVNEENETLVKQYDREKQKRKEIEEVRRWGVVREGWA